MKTDVALIGCGYWGKNIARSLAAIDNLAAIVDDDPVRAKEFAAEYDCDALTFEEVLANGSLPTVAIATPAETHFALAHKALATSKDCKWQSKFLEFRRAPVRPGHSSRSSPSSATPCNLALNLENIGIAAYCPKPLHQQTGCRHYHHKEIEMSRTEWLSTRVLSLPMDPYLTDQQIDRVVNVVRTAVDSAT